MLFRNLTTCIKNYESIKLHEDFNKPNGLLANNQTNNLNNKLNTDVTNDEINKNFQANNNSSLDQRRFNSYLASKKSELIIDLDDDNEKKEFIDKENYFLKK